MIREISVSEIGALLDCPQKHDFSHGGHTLGVTIKPKVAAVTLRRGRAWGSAVATWHAIGDLELAMGELGWALAQDALDQEAHGVYVDNDRLELLARLQGLLAHYTATVERMPLERPELELRVPLPSRTGRRRSNRYGFVGYVDGLTRDRMGLWVVEFKLRGQLTRFEQAVRSRQVRWYAWAAERALGEPVQGVILDERLAEAPKPPRWVKGRGKDASPVPSHAKDQLCTGDAYRAACQEAGVDVVEETAAHMDARDWQIRHRVILRRDEIVRAERELVAAAQLVADMDSGARHPIANPSPFRCPGCAFRGPCLNTADSELIDLEFHRTVPKRLRPPDESRRNPGVPVLSAAPTLQFNEAKENEVSAQPGAVAA